MMLRIMSGKMNAQNATSIQAVARWRTSGSRESLHDFVDGLGRLPQHPAVLHQHPKMDIRAGVDPGHQPAAEIAQRARQQDRGRSVPLSGMPRGRYRWDDPGRYCAMTAPCGPALGLSGSARPFIEGPRGMTPWQPSATSTSPTP